MEEALSFNHSPSYEASQPQRLFPLLFSAREKDNQRRVPLSALFPFLSSAGNDQRISFFLFFFPRITEKRNFSRCPSSSLFGGKERHPSLLLEKDRGRRTRLYFHSSSFEGIVDLSFSFFFPAGMKGVGELFGFSFFPGSWSEVWMEVTFLSFSPFLPPSIRIVGRCRLFFLFSSLLGRKG